MEIDEQRPSESRKTEPETHVSNGVTNIHTAVKNNELEKLKRDTHKMKVTIDLMPCVEDAIISNELHKTRGVKKSICE